MNTITAPRAIKKGEEFVIIPRKAYEEFLRVQQTSGKDVVIKHSFKVPKKHEKFYNELDKELTEAMREVREGKVMGPFDSVAELKKSLRK